MTRELALRLKKTLSNEELYKDLVDWLTLQVRDMRDIENVRECSKAQDQALEFKAQLKAKRRLEGILETIVAIKETPEPVKEEGNDQGIDESMVEQ